MKAKCTFAIDPTGHELSARVELHGKLPANKPAFYLHQDFQVESCTSHGKPIEMDLVLAGRDLVAVDAVCGYIAGFSPAVVAITWEATVRGLGVSATEDIEVSGESIESVQRPFMRVLEDDRMKIEGFNLLYGEATCTGCRMGVMSSIFDMKEANQMMYLPGITIVTGDPEIPEDIPKDGLVTVGRCVPKNKRSDRYVKGCPPNNLDIVQAIMGDREKAERHWE